MTAKVSDQIQAAIAALTNDKHRLFVAAYIQTIADGKPNGAEAHRRAGYNAKSPQIASAAADRLLNRAEIKAIVDMAREQAKAASTAAVEEAIGDLEWKRRKLVYIANAGTTKLKLTKGGVEIEGEHADLSAAVRAIQALAKIDGDEAPQKVDLHAHESMLELLSG